MKKIQFDTVHLDQLKIVEDSKCCLKVNAVITKEGVYNYPDGRAFKSRGELLKATPYARGAKITILDHPDTLVVMSQKQMYGTVEKPFFDRDKMRAVLNFDKALCPPGFLNKVRLAAMKMSQPLDVSIGFYYQPDAIPGTWEGQPYDYVMRDIVIDHVAAGVQRGKCASPLCGIGVDALMKTHTGGTIIPNYNYFAKDAVIRIGNDPFADYTDFADCVAKNQDKGDPEAYCAEIKRKTEGSSQASSKGGKPTIRNKKIDYGASKLTQEELQALFDKCVAERVSEGMERQQAEDYCLAATKPEDEPQPPAPAAPPAAPPNPAAAQEVTEPEEKEPSSEDEPTPMQKCINAQMEAGKTQEEAEAWCRDELEGAHQTADSLLKRGEQLLKLKADRDIEETRQQRRHPV